MTTVLGLLLTLGVLIVVHEYAHYRVAVACGVKVQRFSIGFGRVLWRRQFTPGGTEFVVSALPLGGYVRWIDDADPPPPPSEREYTFASKPLWQRAAIVAAGPVSNLLLAVLLFGASYWAGVQEPKAVLSTPVAGSLAERAGLRAGDLVLAQAPLDDDAVGEPDWRPVASMTDLRWELTQGVVHRRSLVLQVRSAGSSGTHSVRLPLEQLGSAEIDAATLRRIGIGAPLREPVISEVKPGTPAANAGLHEGDRVLSIDAQPVADAQRVIELVMASAAGGTPARQQWVVERGGSVLALGVQPRLVRDGERSIGRIDAGVGRAPEMVKVHYGFVDGLAFGARRTWEVSTLSLKMLGRMVIGQTSVKNLTGPITIAEVAGQTLQQGLAYYLGFLALVSVSLGVLNLLPLPMLDGGHLMYYIFEAVTGRPVTGRWLHWLQGGGALILLLVISLALYNDVARLLGLH